MVSILSTAVLGTLLAGSVFLSSTAIFSEPTTTEHNKLGEGVALRPAGCGHQPPYRRVLVGPASLRTAALSGRLQAAT